MEEAADSEAEDECDEEDGGGELPTDFCGEARSKIGAQPVDYGDGGEIDPCCEEGEAVSAGEFGDLCEDLIMGERGAEGVPSESGEKPAPNPFERAPSGGAAGDEQEIFWAGCK